MTTAMTTLHRTSPLAWHCTLSTLTNTSTESAHHERAQSCSLCTFHHTHDHHHGHPCGCCLFDLTSSFYLFAFVLSVFLFPFFHLSDEQQPASTRRSWKTLCNSANNGGVRAPTTSSTSPQVMSPTAMTSTSSRTHQSPSPSRSMPRTRTWMT